MQALLTETGLQALFDLMRRRVLFAFDLDGTLAPIVDHPADARVPDAIAERLRQLVMLAPVAVVTGRSVDDARSRLGFRPHYLVGNHGAEGLWPLADSDGLERLRARWLDGGAGLSDAGIVLEDKHFSLALHYRQSPDPQQALEAIRAWLHPLPPDLSTLGGKAVVNVVQRAAPDKADAVFHLLGLSACERLLFAGDDVNDESVFERARPDWLTVRIGSPAAASRAMYCLEQPAALEPVLDQVIRHLNSCG
ncbi:MAG: trehalose-phosphatase [Curvibacter sp.]|nr:MAG: trehalose-phosphatase [Curvibacter sp.]